MMIREYSKTFAPPAPLIDVVVARLDGSSAMSRPALVDSGADGSAIPREVVKGLGLLPADECYLTIGSGREILQPTYLVQLRVLDQAIDAEVLESPFEPDLVILGRDVLNRFRITLDGPQQRMEIGPP